MRLLINVDGSASGNPGSAGIGVVLREPGENGGLDTLLAEISEGIGYATNNQAEYRALIRGLEEAAARGADEVEVRCDSLVVVRQFLGECKINDPRLLKLRRQAVAASRTFKRCVVTHVYGVHNLDADHLAKKARRRGR